MSDDKNENENEIENIAVPDDTRSDNLGQIVGNDVAKTVLRGLLTDPEPVIFLHGPSGIGKTAIATAFARDWFAAYGKNEWDQGDAVRLANCAPPEPALAAAEAWLEAGGYKLFGPTLILNECDRLVGRQDRLFGMMAGEAGRRPGPLILTSVFGPDATVRNAKVFDPQFLRRVVAIEMVHVEIDECVAYLATVSPSHDLTVLNNIAHHVNGNIGRALPMLKWGEMISPPFGLPLPVWFGSQPSNEDLAEVRCYTRKHGPRLAGYLLALGRAWDEAPIGRKKRLADGEQYTERRLQQVAQVWREIRDENHGVIPDLKSIGALTDWMEDRVKDRKPAQVVPKPASEPEPESAAEPEPADGPDSEPVTENAPEPEPATENAPEPEPAEGPQPPALENGSVKAPRQVIVAFHNWISTVPDAATNDLSDNELEAMITRLTELRLRRLRERPSIETPPKPMFRHVRGETFAESGTVIVSRPTGPGRLP